jgi:hypothetical protein
MSTLLITESSADFEKMRNEFYEEIQPQGEMERRYVDDVCHLTWKTLRLRRWEAGIINGALREALSGILRQLLSRDAFPEVPMRLLMAERLARGWLDDEDAKAEVIKLLQQFGLDESAIEAEAFRLRAEDLEGCNRMQADAESRLQKTLRMIGKLRKTFGTRLRQSSERILDNGQAPTLVPAEN